MLCWIAFLCEISHAKWRGLEGTQVFPHFSPALTALLALLWSLERVTVVVLALTSSRPTVWRHLSAHSRKPSICASANRISVFRTGANIMQLIWLDITKQTQKVAWCSFISQVKTGQHKRAFAWCFPTNKCLKYLYVYLYLYHFVLTGLEYAFIQSVFRCVAAVSCLFSMKKVQFQALLSKVTLTCCQV